MSSKGPPTWLYLVLATAAVLGAWMLAWDWPGPRRKAPTVEVEAPAKEQRCEEH